MNLKARLIVQVLASVVAAKSALAQTQPAPRNTTPQNAGSRDRAIGESYATLRPEQRRLVDEFVGRYNQATGSELIPEHAYDNARLSVRTTFDAVSHALLNARITDATGKTLGHAIDLVEGIDEVMGEEAGVGGDRQFRVYAYLKPSAFDALSNSQEFFRDKDNVTYHKGFPICFRLKDGPPSIQFSISYDKRMADIDVDYRSFKFPQALVNGHLTAANSDVRAGNNLGRHDSRWVGLSGWWQDLFAQLGGIAKPPKESGTRSLAQIPLNPGVKAVEGVDKSTHDFLQTWVVDKQPSKSVAYFSRRSYACLEAHSEKYQKNTLLGMVQLRAEMAMREFGNRVGKVSSVSDVFVADDKWSNELKPAKNAFASEFRLVSLPPDMAQDEECVSAPENSSGKRSKEKFYATVFREKQDDRRTMLLLWARERGYWKIIAIRFEDSTDAGIVPKNTEVYVEPVEQESQMSAGDPATVKDITQFYLAWILKRNAKQALLFVSKRSYLCLRAPSEEQGGLTPLARIQSGLEQALNEIPPGENLIEMMSSVQPVNDTVHLVEHPNSKAFAIMAVPNRMADGFLCANRQLPDESRQLQQDPSDGTYYLSGSRLNYGEEESPALVLLWAKEESGWKVVAWTIDVP